MPHFTWQGEKPVKEHFRNIPYRLIHCDDEQSLWVDGEGGDKGSDTSGTQNLLVEGDNLEALKALNPYYKGRVKLAYIDPPYNTGNEGWVYNDRVNAPEIRDWIGKTVGDREKDMDRHDKWLCMMWPRLTLLHEMFREDGVIIVSIDDNEIHHLRLLLDDVFGEQNFIAELVWEKTRKNDAKFFSIGHEYMLVYAKSLSLLRELGTVWREAKPGASDVMEEYLRLRELYGEGEEATAAIETGLRAWYRSLAKIHPAKKLSRYKQVDAKGPWRDRDISWPGGEGPAYDVIHPVTGQPCAVPPSGWRYSTVEAMQRQIELGNIVFRADHTEPPFRKAHLAFIPEEIEDEDGQVDIDVEDNEGGGEETNAIAGLQVMPSVLYRQSQAAVRHLRTLMGGNVFENPKDHELLARLIRYCTSPNGGDIVLDSFAGSGTTGHAVLQVNREDAGNRRFILIEMEPDIARNITAERLRRVGATLGGGFRFCHLGKTLIDEDGPIREGVRYNDLAHHVFFTETGHPLPRRLDESSSLIGVTDGVAYYLLWRGRDEVTQLDAAAVRTLTPHDGPRVVFADGCALTEARLRKENITFKHIPYEVKVS